MKKLYEGVRIIDFSTNIAGPVGTATMADFGAEVIKVEPPVKGEPTRMVNPMLEGYSFASWWLNHGKKSVTLDMRDPEGMALAKKIAAAEDGILKVSADKILYAYDHAASDKGFNESANAGGVKDGVMTRNGVLNTNYAYVRQYNILSEMVQQVLINGVAPADAAAAAQANFVEVLEDLE